MDSSDSEDEGTPLCYGIVEYLGQSEHASDCGYCKSTRDPGNTYEFFQGLWAHRLPVQAYQSLMDRNWRRCGKYLYKPINEQICCPMYTIRCDSTKFQLRRSQKRVLKTFNNYIKHGIKPLRATTSHLQGSNSDRPLSTSEAKMLRAVPMELDDSKRLSANSKVVKSNSNQMKSNSNQMKSSLKQDSNQEEGGPAGGSTVIDGVPSSFPKPSKAKFKRRQRLVAKVMKREQCSETEAVRMLHERSVRKQPKAKTLEELLGECEGQQVVHRFKTRFVPARSLVDATETGFEVFRKYQMSVHHETEDEVNFRGYRRFLLDSSLDLQSIRGRFPNDPNLPKQYGPYHQQYFIDDRLVAVAVLDILPKCISSVYLFYDPEFSFLNLGVYSALREIALVRQYQQYVSALRYYYMGYYIYTCPKMRYKGKFQPSDLLCCETCQWFALDRCTAKLEHTKYARFCDDPNVIDGDGIVPDQEVMIMYNGVALSLAEFKRKRRRRRPFGQGHGQGQGQAEEEEETKEAELWAKVNEYARLVGRGTCSRVLYYMGNED